MTGRERLLASINLKVPDQVPIFMTVTPQVAESLSVHLGIDSYTVADSPLSQNRISYHEMMVRAGNDAVGIGACSPAGSPTREVGSGVLTNEWQVKYREVGMYTEMVEHPLAGAEKNADINRFLFPDPRAKGRYELARQVSDQYGGDYALVGDLECTLFEAAWYLTGFEKFLMDMALEKDYIAPLLDHIQGYSIEVGRELIRLGADVIWLGDDLGTQGGPLISLDMWRRHFKDRMSTIIRVLKADNPEVKIAYHSCGSYFAFIPDLIEIGVDILNALQPTAEGMELVRLKALFGEQVAFFGGLDTQEVLPFGTLAEVEEEAKRVIAASGVGGGLILAGAHNIQPDVSVEKLLRIYEIVREYGIYPLID